MVAASLLLTGCSKGDPEPVVTDGPLVSTAQGLGEPKISEAIFNASQFEEIYHSTNGAISFEKLDALDWKVERVMKAAEGEQLPAGDNFRATATSNFSYSDAVKAWVQELKTNDGWTAANEVKPEPRADEKRYANTKEDYRMKPYSIDLTKGGTTMNVKIENGTITLIINSK